MKPQDNVTAVLRQLMAARGCNQHDIAKVLQVTQASTSLKFRGKSRWSLDDP